MEDPAKIQTVRGFWTPERVTGLATATILAVAYPIAVDQGYLRYNAYALPCLFLAAAILYLIVFFTAPSVKRYGREVFQVNPKVGSVIAVFVVGVLIAFLITGFNVALRYSKAHVEAARRADSKIDVAKERVLEPKPSEPVTKPVEPPPLALAPKKIKVPSPRKTEVVPAPVANPPAPVPAPVPSQTVNVDHGIGGIGGTYINPTVVNEGPPPLKLSYGRTGSIDPTKLTFPNYKPNYITTFAVVSNVDWTPVSVVLTFDGPIMEVLPMGSQLSVRYGLLAPNTGYVYYQSPAMSSESPLEIEVLSIAPVKLVGVEKSPIRR
jgi:hypothetical protein